MQNKADRAQAEARRLWSAYDKLPATNPYKRQVLEEARKASRKARKLEQEETV